MKKTEISKLDWDKTGGLLPAIVQHVRGGRVLMLGYVNVEALERCFDTGKAVFYSRSRKRLWMKGETSGNTLTINAIDTDCDSDAILLRVQPTGPTCHLGFDSCFSQAMPFLEYLEELVDQRVTDRPAGSYTAELAAGGIAAAAQKVGEEAVEVALAAVSGDRTQLSAEAADLLFHLVVLLRLSDLGFDDAIAVLQQRDRRVSTVSEPASS